jgi:hypothetical protein
MKTVPGAVAAAVPDTWTVIPFHASMSVQAPLKVIPAPSATVVLLFVFTMLRTAGE